MGPTSCSWTSQPITWTSPTSSGSLDTSSRSRTPPASWSPTTPNSSTNAVPTCCRSTVSNSKRKRVICRNLRRLTQKPNPSSNSNRASSPSPSLNRASLKVSNPVVKSSSRWTMSHSPTQETPSQPSSTSPSALPWPVVLPALARTVPVNPPWSRSSPDKTNHKSVPSGRWEPPRSVTLPNTPLFTSNNTWTKPQMSTFDGDTNSVMIVKVSTKRTRRSRTKIRSNSLCQSNSNGRTTRVKS